MPRLCAALVPLIAACSGGGSSAPPTRIAIIADSHVIGPQYTEPSENSPADNESILLTHQRLAAVRDRINALDPAPEAVFMLGDVVHAAHHSLDAAWYDANPTGFSEAAALLDGFAMPVHSLMGNHDYDVRCSGERHPKALSEALFLRFFGADPYFAVELGGARLYLLNGQHGRSWDSASPGCDTELASYGAAQLAWLDEELDDGVPAIVMSHYPGLLWDRDENPAVPAQKDIETVLDAHDNVRLYLSGHAHRWVDLSSFFGHEHYIVGATRYDDDNFWVLDLDGDGGVTITDRDKAIWYNSCASTYAYDGATPTLDEDAPETGTCVMGI